MIATAIILITMIGVLPFMVRKLDQLCAEENKQLDEIIRQLMIEYIDKRLEKS